MPLEHNSFLLAVFDITGALVGQRHFAISQLSQKWLRVCEEILASNGEQFAITFAPPLDHIALRFTSESGAAIATFRVGANIANSLLLTSGAVPEADAEVMQMFFESVCATATQLRTSGTFSPFIDMSRIAERPLACVVAWGSPNVPDKDQDVVRELSWHLAGTFFFREQAREKC